MQFLDAEMTMDEIHAFEKELQVDEHLREQLDFQIKLLAASTTNEENDFASNRNEELRSIITTAKEKFFRLNNYNAEIPLAQNKNNTVIDTNAQKQKTIGSGYWLAAASVIVLAFVSALFYYSGEKSNDHLITNKNRDTLIKEQKNTAEVKPTDSKNEKGVDNRKPSVKGYALLAKESYEKDAAINNPPEVLEGALNEYTIGNYETIQKFDLVNIPKTRGENNLLVIKELGHYYKGLSFIETKNYEKALINLQWVTDSSQDKLLQIKSAWYQAIVYLIKSNPNKADSLLIRISTNNTESVYKQKAVSLIQKIKSIRNR